MVYALVNILLRRVKKEMAIRKNKRKKWIKTLYTNPCYGFEIKEQLHKYSSSPLFGDFHKDKRNYKIKIIVEEV